MGTVQSKVMGTVQFKVMRHGAIIAHSPSMFGHQGPGTYVHQSPNAHITVTSYNGGETRKHEENHQLFLRQKAVIDKFLEWKVVTQEQYEKSLHDLMERETITDSAALPGR